MSFRAIVITKTDAGQSVALTNIDDKDLMEGDVTVRVTASSVNYKDGLAITGKAPVVRRFPMIPGIDSAGTVEHSTNPKWKAGDKVVLTGFGVGETHLGAYAERARVRGDWLVRLPAGLSEEQAMAIGTAGLTAMLCVMTLERHAITPAHGPALVTGAAGGVGSIAVALLAKLGFHVIASTGRPEEAAYLKALGASEIIDRKELAGPVRALAKERFGSAIDSVGSTTLANLLSMIKYGGAVAACGLAAGGDLPSSVHPFILRNEALLGVDSVQTPVSAREAAWQRLVRDLDMDKLAAMTTTIPLDQAIAAGHDIIAGKTRGRFVVRLN